MKTNKEVKICFAASSGGHLEEISCLREIANKNNSFLITEESGIQESRFEHIYYLPQINRNEKQFFRHIIYIFVHSFIIFLKERPKYIISTGALVTFPISLIAKIFGAKIIYIESFARTENPSMTGKYMYRIADLFLVQWEELLKYYPKAIYIGGIF